MKQENLKPWLNVMLMAVLYAIWQYVFIKIEGTITFDGGLAAFMLAFVTFFALMALREIVRRIRNHEPLVEFHERRPRRARDYPFVLRVIDRIMTYLLR